ncbi:type IV toxin-antitoxin system AbiEi family antitoxin domain-containing protein [Streptomyces sp. SID13031]|uniref:type IV toxin-antitoxin system AbiEi family antitoxin domain-containing protein n=1 Tax=Streptomyces sp. SID13031 TaxID=2706046 RepID=UPI0013C55045|nr:type IV toxin-antitoxin system AbiEi family antitoxin domain-containing protein [Streptomyces sp. SID13031]NEA37301.1 type IV toxin-antitoxin system AbiEi family antitoxin domain-containing protein [Streptomyces sp. SID13031]
MIDANRGDRMAAIVALVNQHPDGISLKQVEEALGETGDVRRYLSRAEESGAIRKPARGLYAPIPMDEGMSPKGAHGTDGTHPLRMIEETP